MRMYLVKVQHDNGIARLFTPASNKKQAIKTVMDYENCPRRAIVSCERYEERILI